MAYDNIELFQYIKLRAKYNIKNKVFFRNTDILKAAFGVSEEMAYDILKEIMNHTSKMENTKEAVVDAYLKILADGYMPLSKQYELMGGDKLGSIKKEAEKRAANFRKGNLVDLLRIVYNISEKEIEETVVKFLKTVNTTDFSFKVTSEDYYKFLENNVDELDKQYDRFNL